MTPERAAFLAGYAWLTDGPKWIPTANDLADLVDPDAYGIDGLDFVWACAKVSDAIAFLRQGEAISRASVRPFDIAYWAKRDSEATSES